MIYDCFPFNNELDLLEIRLNHHDSFVDKFVLSESTWTYSGKPKRLYYDEVKDQEPFVKFKDKIIHRVYRKWPPDRKGAWDIEHAQRNSLLPDMMPILKDDDLILYLDCDEIIRDRSVIDVALALDCIVMLDMKFCWYYFNCVIKPGSKFQNGYSMESCFNHRWHMGKICRKKHLEQFGNVYELRQHFIWEPMGCRTIFNSGWHFSNLGDPALIYNKFMSYPTDVEVRDKFDLSPELIRERKAKLMDPLGRDVSFVQTELDVPQFVSNNLKRFWGYVLLGEGYKNAIEAFDKDHGISN